CYQVSPAGYIIVPVLRDMAPVKVYSEEGRFEVNETNGFPAMIKEILTTRIRNFVDFYGSIEADQSAGGFIYLDREHQNQWDYYSVTRSELKSSPDLAAASPMETVGPLLTTRWHQGAPYNNFCPWGDGDICVVGCAATAAAQIMAYHHWPPSGVGNFGYYWSGDNSCGGSSGGGPITADFSDPYDWDNIIDYCSGCTSAQQDALAELCFEVGVSFSMDYGVCGSAIYTSQINQVMDAFVDYFQYFDFIDREDRSDHTSTTWFHMIKTQINSGNPMDYFIASHSIVCDGWQTVGDVNQYHMNYGWGGSYNAWYTVDHTYCSWSGCNYLNEFLIRNIVPDKGVSFTASPNVGWAPLEVNFSGLTELTVDSWTWDFGDGGMDNVQDPIYTYNNPGVYDVNLEVDAEGEIRTFMKADYIVVFADTIKSTDASGNSGTTVEITISANNILSLHRLQIPIEYSGPVELTYKGYSVIGCRTEGFDDIDYINYDSNNKRFTLNMEVGEGVDLSPGAGPLVVLTFDIEGAENPNDVSLIELDGYNTYLPQFYGLLAEYQPALENGTITYTGCCIGSTGNTNCTAEEEPDISDITRLIDFLYTTHDALCCPEEADCNGSGGEPDISDITALIDFLYLTHEPLAACF
ncbi:MAG: C10 family peptidase, partial [Candidatus Zixiibacteriota bacterium]